MAESGHSLRCWQYAQCRHAHLCTGRQHYSVRVWYAGCNCPYDQGTYIRPCVWSARYTQLPRFLCPGRLESGPLTEAVTGWHAVGRAYWTSRLCQTEYEPTTVYHAGRYGIPE